MGTVYIDGSVKAVVDSTPSHIRASHVTVKVEVYGVPTQTEGLTYIRQLHVLYPTNNQILIRPWRVHENLSTKLVRAQLLPKPALETRLCGEFTWKTTINVWIV